MKHTYVFVCIDLCHLSSYNHRKSSTSIPKAPTQTDQQKKLPNDANGSHTHKKRIKERKKNRSLRPIQW